MAPNSFGYSLVRGTKIRISEQDCRRGTGICSKDTKKEQYKGQTNSKCRKDTNKD